MQHAFSVIIPSWNNLPYLKLCVESLRKHSSVQHQIVVHVNEGSDGTLDWVRNEGIDYTYSAANVGVCLACNAMRSKVRNDYIVFLNDDMYVLPGWDEALSGVIDRQPDKMFYLSGTMIQPHNFLDVGITADYGDSVETFQRDRLLAEYSRLPMSDWQGATWPPSLLHRDVWDLVGGFSIEYSPGMYSDPDLSAKLWMVGVRRFLGVSDCRVYHFETKSTARVRRNDGRVQFMLKWGLTNSEFRQQLTRLGQPLGSEPRRSNARWQRLKTRLKAVAALLGGKQFGPVNPLEK
ncbi:MAG: glycosyltransferase [Bacteroidales bacterium]|nr:glycosyltransferase [Bacteroidales bacterium]